MNDIKRIVLTGGPCAGKTTALVRIIEHFSSLGFKVFTIPEVPTLFTQAGMNYLTKNQAFFYEGEKATLEIQLALEDKFMGMAQQCTQPSIIVCDRGAMDISAYMAPEMWEQLIHAVGTTTPELRERYDAVRFADLTLAVVGEGNDRRGGAVAFAVGDDDRLAAFHDGNA